MADVVQPSFGNCISSYQSYKMSQKRRLYRVSQKKVMPFIFKLAANLWLAYCDNSFVEHTNAFSLPKGAQFMF